MKVRTHMEIARLSVKKINDIKLSWIERVLFLFGTIEPDLGITQFIHPHFYVKSADYIYTKLKRLKSKNKKGLLSAFELGRVVHYLSDFCCFVHSGGGIGKVAEHVLYERNIQKYLIGNYNEIFSRIIHRPYIMNEYDNMICFIEETIEDYKASKPCFYNDIEKATDMCSALLYGLYNTNTVIVRQDVLSIGSKLASV